VKKELEKGEGKCLDLSESIRGARACSYGEVCDSGEAGKKANTFEGAHACPRRETFPLCSFSRSSMYSFLRSAILLYRQT